LNQTAVHTVLKHTEEGIEDKTMDNIALMLLCLFAGIFLLWFSRHKKSYDKTAETQGLERAKKKFKLMMACGFFLLLGAVLFGIFAITGF
jgi:ABC-type Fe3+ transport system permease subunit